MEEKRNARKEIHSRVQDQDGQGIPGQKGKEPTLSKSDFAFENKTSNSTFVMDPFFDVSLTKGTH